MFVRLKRVRANGRDYEYVQLVQSHRVGGRVRQEVVANLGRYDQLVASGSLDSVITGLGRLSERLTVLDALRDGDVVAEKPRPWGPTLVFDRLWRDLGLHQILGDLARARAFEFDPERVAFAMALQRLGHGARGSDRDGRKWLSGMHGFGDVPALHQYYRTAGFLADVKEELELRLYERGRDLFNREVDVALFDTTTAYFEGEGPTIACKGKSKDGKYDHNQIVIGVVLTRDGWPLCAEVWPGNKTDVTTVRPILEKLSKRFSIGRVVFVADRGMTSRKNIAALEQAGYDYIVGSRMRADHEVRDRVLARAGRYRDVEENLRVKQVEVDGRRYVICLNPIEAERDRLARESILTMLREKVAGQGAKVLTSNRGFQRFLATPKGAPLTIDEAAVARDARYDGKYVLRTSTDWAAADVARAYKTLWQVEHFFRDFKDVVTVRPIFHHNERNVRGHVVGCFLGLTLAVALRKGLDAIGTKVEWVDVVRDLHGVCAVPLELGGTNYVVRTELPEHAYLAFRAVGARPPPRLQRTVGMGVVAKTEDHPLSA